MKKNNIGLVFLLFLSSFLTFGAINNSVFQKVKADSVIFLDENYTNLKISTSKCYSYTHVANSGGSAHGLVPAEKWTDPINAATGNVIYKINANEGKAFDTLSLSLSFMARTDLVMKDGTRTSQAGINVYSSLSPDLFESPVQTYQGWTNDGSTKDFTLDLSVYSEGQSYVYIKVELCHNEGVVDLSQTGVKLKSVKFTGTEKESDILFVSKSDTFTSSQSAQCSFDSFSNLGGFNNSNGLVPTASWGGEVDIASNAYVIYSLSTPVGPTFKTLNISISGRVWSGGNGTYDGQSVTTAGCKMQLYISSDINNFNTPVKVFEAITDSNPKNFNYTDTQICLNNSDIFIKIELVHPAMRCALSNVGTRLYSASFSGGYDKNEIIPSVTMNETHNLSDGIDNFEKTGIFSSFSSSGRTYYYASGNKASVVIPINCNSLYKYYNCSFTQYIRCTTYNGAEGIQNALKYSVSVDGIDYVDVVSLDTDTNWTRGNVKLNLSSYVRGYHNVFVKISIDWSGKAYSHDWIAISNYTITGDLVERDTFNINYENLLDGVNNPNNPALYHVGDIISLLDATRNNYAFDGWYLDEDYTLPFEGVTASTKGDITVYAKWNANFISVTLNAGSGEFDDLSKTIIVPGNYNLPLYRANMPTPTFSEGAFINWFKDRDFNNPFIFAEDYGESDLITGPITLYAKYGNPVHVTYVYGNGMEDVVFYQEVNQKASRVNDPLKEGYIFGGWYLSGQPYNFDSLLSADITLEANWYYIYSLTYTGLEGGTHSNPSSYTINQKNIPLTDPFRNGYTFLGWYLDGTKITEIDTSLAKDLTIEARWKVVSYKLIINCDEHSSIIDAPENITIEGLTLQIKVDVGYRIKNVTANNVVLSLNNDKTVFVGGYDKDVTIMVETTASYYFHDSIDIDFKDQTDISEYVVDCNNVKNYTGDKSSSKYGWLVPEDYSKAGFITYAINAGEGQSINSLLLTGIARVFSINGSVALLDLYFSKDGEDFELVNSFPSTTDGEAYIDISVNLTSRSKGEQTVYIKYVIQSGNYDWVALDSVHASMSFTCVTVKFMDGDTIMYTNAEQVKGAPITLLENPTKPGYQFLGWYTDKSLRHKVSDSDVALEDMSVYAKWESETYNIHYIVPEGANIGDNVETYTIEDEIELAPAEKKNYKFIGWYDNPDFTGNKIDKISKGTYGDLTLYGKLEEGIKVHYELNGGTNSELNPEVYFKDESADLFDPYREGYVFGGWYLDSEFTQYVDYLSGDGEEITLYANWIKDNDDSGSAKGCGGSIVDTSIIMFALTGLAILLVIKKEVY